MTPLDRRFAELAKAGPREITADDVTLQGAFAVDAAHTANGRQSAIGSHFRKWASEGLIRRTGRVVRSKAPHRKGGMIQVWEVTETGVAWARRRQVL